MHQAFISMIVNSNYFINEHRRASVLCAKQFAIQFRIISSCYLQNLKVRRLMNVFLNMIQSHDQTLSIPVGIFIIVSALRLIWVLCREYYMRIRIITGLWLDNYIYIWYTNVNNMCKDFHLQSFSTPIKYMN